MKWTTQKGVPLFVTFLVLFDQLLLTSDNKFLKYLLIFLKLFKTDIERKSLHVFVSILNFCQFLICTKEMNCTNILGFYTKTILQENSCFPTVFHFSFLLKMQQNCFIYLMKINLITLFEGETREQKNVFVLFIFSCFAFKLNFTNCEAFV